MKRASRMNEAKRDMGFLKGVGSDVGSAPGMGATRMRLRGE
jgi:hypothetical protein